MNEQRARGIAFAVGYCITGAITAFVLTPHNPLPLLIMIVVVGLVVRAYGYRLARRRGEDRPPWSKWL
ncbi:MAG TPA: hypothetical protein VHD87_05325 [Acidimicrobiales bacterium]|nr:hypothetical protein [Acidimicrobiales bacterium]